MNIVWAWLAGIGRPYDWTYQQAFDTNNGAVQGMSMDPEFMSRYMSDENKEQAPAKSLSEEPDVADVPQAPAEPSVPDTPRVAAAPRHQEPNETTRIIRPEEAAAAAELAAQRAQQPPAPPAAAPAVPPSAPPGFDPRGFDPRLAPPAEAYQGFDPRAAETTAPQHRHAAPPQAQPNFPPQQHYGALSGSFQAAPGAPQSLAPQTGWAEASGQWGAEAAAAQSPARLRADDASLVRHRKVPPEMGWRHAVWVGSGHVINLGAGAYEQALIDDQKLIASNIPGNYLIAVLSVRGGVGKTAVTIGLGTAFAKYRTDQVIAIDANPTYGKLARRVDPKATSTIKEFYADQHITGYPMARRHTGKNAQGLEVLASNQNVANGFQLTPAVFTATTQRTKRFYQLALVDCGPEIEHQVMGTVINSADALVIVGTMNFDGAEAAETTLNWLAARGKHELLKRSVLVLNDIYNNATKDFVEKVNQTLGKHVGAVETVPWDAHIRDASVMDWEALRRPTERAYISVAATLAKGFPTAGTIQARTAGAVQQ